MWTAATCSPETRRLFVNALGYWIKVTSTGVAFTDPYETINQGSWLVGISRCWRWRGRRSFGVLGRGLGRLSVRRVCLEVARALSIKRGKAGNVINIKSFSATTTDPAPLSQPTISPNSFSSAPTSFPWSPRSRHPYAASSPAHSSLPLPTSWSAIDYRSATAQSKKHPAPQP